MADYKGMYTKLFNAVTDAVHDLQVAQTETEEMFLSQEETNITVFDKPDEDE